MEHLPNEILALLLNQSIKDHSESFSAPLCFCSNLFHEITCLSKDLIQ